MNGRQKGITAGFASAVLLGLTPIFGKQALLLGFSPLSVVAIRSGIATLLLFLMLLIFRRQFFYIYNLGLIGCLLAGFVNGAGSILYYTALSRVDATVGQLLYSFYPIFVAFWLFIDRQPLSRMTLVRLLIAFPGSYLLLSSGSHPVDLIGAAMMMGAAILYALHLIINQRVLFEVPAPTVTFYTMLAMFTTVGLAYAIFDRTLPAAHVSWMPLVGLGVVTFISRLTLFMGVKHLGGMQTALLGLGELLVTVILAVWLLHERLMPLQWLGAGMLALNLLLVGADQPPAQKRHQSGLLGWLTPTRVTPTDLSSPST